MTPAALGGTPAFDPGLPFARPTTPILDRVVARVQPSYDRGILTNGPLVREFEETAAARLGVAHAVAVSNCTSGLMLALRALELDGAVVLPSFTFSASAHAVAWNGLTPVFAECVTESLQADADDMAARAKASETPVAALLATHIFGAPTAVEAVRELGERLGIPVVFDAAHALGSERRGAPIGGNGAAEVFSLSPTKPVVAGEGGLVATNRDDVARSVRIGRDYGNPGSYDTEFVGLNARMSEFHAAIALESLAGLDEHLSTRRELALAYRRGLVEIPGVAVQAIDDDDRSTFKDLTILVEPEAFGLSRDEVRSALDRDGVDTRLYFFPPVHRHRAYANLPMDDLPVTDDAAGRVLSLPLFNDMGTDAVERVVATLAAIQGHAAEIRTALART